MRQGVYKRVEDIPENQLGLLDTLRELLEDRSQLGRAILGDFTNHLHNRGWTFQLIAELAEVSTQTIHRWRQDHQKLVDRPE